MDSEVTVLPFVKIEFVEAEPVGEGMARYSTAISFAGLDEARLPEVLRFVADGLEKA